jgi:hypothetical protein
MRSILPWAAAALLAAAPAVQGQDVCAENFKWPKVGAWAEYQGVYNKQTPMTTRYAVVGSESRNGADYKWIEFKMHDAKKNTDMIYQMLVPGGGPLQMEGIEEVVMKMGERPAMKMTGMMLGMMRTQLGKNMAFKDACTEVTMVGVEKVTVPAGSFTAKHFHSAKYETDMWVDKQVPFSMLKSVGKSHELVLAATGDGAKSGIDETPQEMPGMEAPKAK